MVEHALDPAQHLTGLFQHGIAHQIPLIVDRRRARDIEQHGIGKLDPDRVAKRRRRTAFGKPGDGAGIVPGKGDGLSAHEASYLPKWALSVARRRFSLRPRAVARAFSASAALPGSD